MSNQPKHSPEPWSTVNGCDAWEIIDANREFIAFEMKDEGESRETIPHDYRRIVTCINACRGIPNEFLESVIEADKVSGRSLITEAVELAVHIQVNKANREAMEAGGTE